MTAPVADVVGNMYATFTDPLGGIHELTNTVGIGTDDELGWFTTPEVSGWGAKPYEFVVDPLPRGGESVRFIRSQAGRVIWPLHIWGQTHQTFLERYREIRRAFMSTVHRRSPGILTVSRPDGRSRQLDVYYEEGFKGEPGEDWLYANPKLTLYAPDGYWRDTEATIVTRAYSPGVSFFNPFGTLSSSQVFGNTVINNPGEVDAWPVWTITGPAESLTATNNTTGQSFILTYSLMAGETVTITTLRPTVRGPAGQNLVASLNWPTAQLWPLYGGDNNVEFTVGGSASGTKIQLTFYPRYEGA